MNKTSTFSIDQCSHIFLEKSKKIRILLDEYTFLHFFSMTYQLFKPMCWIITNTVKVRKKAKIRNR